MVLYFLVMSFKVEYAIGCAVDPAHGLAYQRETCFDHTHQKNKKQNS